MAQEFEVASGHLSLSIDPVVATYPDGTGLIDVEYRRRMRSDHLSGRRWIAHPDLHTDPEQFKGSLSFHFYRPVEPGRAIRQVIVSIGHIQSTNQSAQPVCHQHFVMHPAPDIPAAALQQWFKVTETYTRKTESFQEFV